MKPLNVIFAGTPSFGLNCLDAIYRSSHNLISVYTQPCKKVGRGQKIRAPDVKLWALAHNIAVFQPVNFKKPEDVEQLRALKPDVIVVIAYGLILPQAVLEIPKFGCINVHASLLPRWRGASPIQQAILHGDSRSGVCIMQMDKGLDTGKIFTSVATDISSDETAQNLHDRLSTLAVTPLLSTLDNLAKMNPTPQAHTGVTYAPKIKKEDAKINFLQSAATIYNSIRAYNPWPIAYAHILDKVIRVFVAKILPEESSLPPGTIISASFEGLKIATLDNVLLIEQIQLSGGKVMAFADYLNGHRSLFVPGIRLQ